jgi:hypothetical protein
METIIGSITFLSRYIPPFAIFFVSSSSALLGLRLLDGWLWLKIILQGFAFKVALQIQSFFHPSFVIPTDNILWKILPMFFQMGSLCFCKSIQLLTPCLILINSLAVP